jgi:hypothetical protein
MMNDSMPPQPAFAPLGYESPQPGSPPPRPAVVTALATVGIVWASLSLLSHTSGLVLLVAWLPHALFDDPLLLVLMLPRLFIPVALGALLLTAAIATLRQSQRGRKGMIVWSWIMIVLSSLNIMGPFLLIPYVSFMIFDYRPLGMVHLPTVSLLPLGYAIWALIVLFRPQVKSAFVSHSV